MRDGFVTVRLADGQRRKSRSICSRQALGAIARLRPNASVADVSSADLPDPCTLSGHAAEDDAKNS